MKKLLLIILIVGVICLVGGFLLAFFMTGNSALTPMPSGKVCFEDHCFSVEIAKTEQQQERGLM